MRLAVISDTHIPSRAAGIPDWVVEEIEQSDHVVHAGDFDSPEAYQTVVDIAPEITAVLGNIDPQNLGLPHVTSLDLAGVRFVVTHGTGPIETYDERVAKVVDENAAEGLTVGVSGHTHQRRDEQVDGYRLLNPGSATGADPATEVSMFVVEVENGEVDVTALTG